FRPADTDPAVGAHLLQRLLILRSAALAAHQLGAQRRRHHVGEVLAQVVAQFFLLGGVVEIHDDRSPLSVLRCPFPASATDNGQRVTATGQQLRRGRCKRSFGYQRHRERATATARRPVTGRQPDARPSPRRPPRYSRTASARTTKRSGPPGTTASNG